MSSTNVALSGTLGQSLLDVEEHALPTDDFKSLLMYASLKTGRHARSLLGLVSVCVIVSIFASMGMFKPHPLPGTEPSFFLSAQSTSNFGAIDSIESWTGYLVIIAVVAVVAVLVLQFFAVRGVKAAIEKYDRDYLGADVTFGDVSVNLFTGRVELRDTVIENPSQAYTFKEKMGIVCDDKGFVQEVTDKSPAHKKGITKGARIVKVNTDPYSGKRLDLAEKSGFNYTVKVRSRFQKYDHLLKLYEACLDLNTGRMVKSMLREIEIEKLIIKDIEVNLEFESVGSATSNLTAIVDNMMAAICAPPKLDGDIQPVYDYWHKGNKNHTFHFEPPWETEVRNNVCFFAHKTQAPGTYPVYAYWNWWNKEHTFHFQPAWGQEKEGTVQFYAFKEQAPGTEPVYGYWHPGNKEHTLHFAPAWDLEEKGEILMYAYRADPTGKSKVLEQKALLLPVYAFWHRGMGQHTFHMLPAWDGEKQGTVQFFAYDRKVEGTVPVYDFWNSQTRRKTFHMGEPKANEEKRSALFWVFPEYKEGLEPVYEFFHAANKSNNIHCGEPWEGETKLFRSFCTYRLDPNARAFFLKKVHLHKIKARGGTRHVGRGAAVEIDDIQHDDFSDTFGATTVNDIGLNMAKEMFRKVSVGLG